VSQVQEILNSFLKELPDLLATDVVHVESGLSIGGASVAREIDLSAASAAYAEVVKSNARALELLGIARHATEDILVTTVDMHVLLRVLGGSYYHWLAVGRQSSLGLPRFLMRRYQPALLAALGETAGDARPA
jgi:predicted regulator of Ras-like GTPase activity (Roadblock/LC7/MglB family)